MKKKQKHWFKVWFGKWDEGSFDPEHTFVFVESWSADSAIKKALKNTDQEDGEIITKVDYLGYPQI